MEREYTLMLMVRITMESGKMINSMGLVSSSGLMEQFTKDNTSKARRMEKENLHLLMARYIKEIFR